MSESTRLLTVWLKASGGAANKGFVLAQVDRKSSL